MLKEHSGRFISHFHYAYLAKEYQLMKKESNFITLLLLTTAGFIRVTLRITNMRL